MSSSPVRPKKLLNLSVKQIDWKEEEDAKEGPFNRRDCGDTGICLVNGQVFDDAVIYGQVEREGERERTAPDDVN